VAYVLQFWGTWCTPCVAEMPELHALWQRYGGPDFQMVSLSVEDSREAVERFRKDLWPMPWLHVVLEGEAGREIVDLLEVTSYPTTILVGRSGVIVSLKDPDEGLAKDVETLLGLAGESG
jgi:thiol-disulfide isomerase/thioredoxin